MTTFLVLIFNLRITVGGRCFFTAENYKDFSIMMRTNQESENLQIPPNSEFDWPGVESLLLCPLCSAKAQILSQNEYWMIFYPLLQVIQEATEMTLVTRTICRLVCLDCMQQLLDGMYVTVKHESSSLSLSAMEILQEAGSASFLQDGPPRPETHAHVDDPLDAWTLYTLWESTGEWESLQNDYRAALARSMTEIPSREEQTDLKDRYGKKCGNAECDKVHGKKENGQILRLSVVCKMCKLAHYCSKTCRAKAWTVHSLECEAKKLPKRVHCDTCRKALPYTEMKKCSKCRSAIYCSIECQREDWILHKPTCKKNES